MKEKGRKKLCLHARHDRVHTGGWKHTHIYSPSSPAQAKLSTCAVLGTLSSPLVCVSVHTAVPHVKGEWNKRADRKHPHTHTVYPQCLPTNTKTDLH